MVPTERDWFETLVGVAGAVNTLVLFAILVALVPAIVSFTKALKQLRAVLDRAYDDLKPFTENANKISADVREITESVRDEVKQVSETVGQATRGIQTAVQSTERRIRDFGALMDVAQTEAEKAVVGTAAVIHGVRTGVSAAKNGDKEAADDAERRTPRVRRRKRSS